MPYISSLFRWLQRKRYQYEVTFSLYMLTPTEKFIFSALTASGCLASTLITITDSFLFLFLSMIIIAASLYLPEHISSIVRRLCFYWGGDETAAVKSGIGSTGSIMSKAASSVLETGRPIAGGETGDVLQRLGEL